jgi:uncharacterized protein YaaR (DUF327 family)
MSMKIGESNPLPDLPNPNRRIKGKDDASSAKGSTAARRAEEPQFGQALLDASRQQAARALDLILADLDASGERLAAAQSFEELERYKGLVQEFLKKVTQGLGKLHFSDGGQERQAKVHVILQRVDQELGRLAEEVLKRQAGQLRILERLDQIRGLLLDLYK